MRILLIISCKYILSLHSVFAQTSSELISDLRIAIFPSNPYKDSRTTYYGCVTERDSLILYIRKKQPNIEACIDILQRIAENQNKSDTMELNTIYTLQVRIFKNEWGWGFRQFPICDALRSQLKLIHALETTLASFRLDELYPTPEEKFIYWRKSSDLFYEKMYKGNTDFEKYLDSAAINYIHNLSQEEIQLRADKQIWIHPYYRQVRNDYNAFGGISLSWTFITPFINDIKEFYQNSYNQFLAQEPKNLAKEPNNSLAYALDKSFFRHYTNQYDFPKLMSLH